MDSSLLSAVVLPLSLFIVMSGIGLSLRLTDFTQVFRFPKIVVVGLVGQLVLLPLFALLIILILPFSSPLVAAGFLIIALAPGGATSNLFTFLAKGETAASITLTAVVSLITPFTIPLLTVWFLNVFEPGQIQLPIADTIVQLLVITVVPVSLGMALRHFKPALAERMMSPVQWISLGTLFLIIAGIVAQTWPVFVANWATMLPATTLLVMGAFLGGYWLARVTGLNEAGRRTLSFEIGLQNGTTALLVTATILQIPETTIAPMFYSIIMFVGAGLALLMFRRNPAPALAEPA
ncbi:MAG: bile acid:sodium symporter [Natronospirillum sp.]